MLNYQVFYSDFRVVEVEVLLANLKKNTCGDYKAMKIAEKDAGRFNAMSEDDLVIVFSEAASKKLNQFEHTLFIAHHIEFWKQGQKWISDNGQDIPAPLEEMRRWIINADNTMIGLWDPITVRAMIRKGCWLTASAVAKHYHHDNKFRLRDLKTALREKQYRLTNIREFSSKNNNTEGITMYYKIDAGRRALENGAVAPLSKLFQIAAAAKTKVLTGRGYGDDYIKVPQNEDREVIEQLFKEEKLLYEIVSTLPDYVVE